MKNKHYQLETREVFELLKTDRNGLSNEEAENRLEKFGRNKLPSEKSFSLLKLFLGQFNNPLTYILFAAFVISLFTNHIADAFIILAVILVSSILSFIQEYKANKALSHLKNLISYKTKVLRGGKRMIIKQEEVVAGDIIILSPGDKISADARLIETNNLKVIEASLTGESNPSQKIIEKLPQNTALADRENMVYMGSVVSDGQGIAVVTAIGQETEIGKVANLVKEITDTTTPLQEKINDFGKKLSIVLVLVSLFLFAFGVLSGREVFEMFLVTVAVVVSAVPEGLLPAMTVILAVGMRKLSKHKGLVRRMVAAETLGSVTAICSDKTGTITKGEMRVAEFFTKTEKDLILKIGLLCNNAIVENPKSHFEKWKIIGNSTEKALLLAGAEFGLNKDNWNQKEKKSAEISFNSKNKIMVTFYKKNENENHTAYAKGAPERILNLCSKIKVGDEVLELGEKNRKEIVLEYEKKSASGMRILAFAYKEYQDISSKESSIENLNNYIFVGFVTIKDPIRAEVKEAIELCKGAGVKTMIITGDHKLTAISIAEDLGMDITEKNVLTGIEMNRMDDKELSEKVKSILIFARVSPEHKLRIVSALQANGEVVSMTGDGVNDAPALKKADIGVAVGSGTDVTKEVADLILLDNNFNTIVRAIKRGRQTFNNIRKVILYLIVDSFTEIVLIGGAVLLKLPLPILPVQILWIKLAESAAPAIALAFDDIDEGVMKEKPVNRKQPIVDSRMKKIVLFYALIMDSLLFSIFYYYWTVVDDLDLARTIVFVGLGLSSFFYIFAVRGLKTSILKINPFSNKFLLWAIAFGFAMLISAVYYPPLSNILKTVPLDWNHWVVLTLYAMSSVVVYESLKKLIFKSK